METRLTPQDFKLKTIDQRRVHYFEYEYGNGQHITIEPVNDGYSVAAYDEHGIIQSKKHKVLWINRVPEHQPVQSTSTFKLAVSVARGLLERQTQNA